MASAPTGPSQEVEEIVKAEIQQDEQTIPSLPAPDQDPDKLFGQYGTTATDDEDITITARTAAVLFAVSLLSLAASLAVTGPSGLVTYIVRDLGDAQNASWISTASTCLQAATSSPIAFVTDLYGRRWMLIFTSVMAIIGTFVSGSAHSLQTVIAGQCITGFCLATKPLCYAIGSEVLPRKYRAAVQFWIGWLALAGQLVGAIGGPAFLDKSSTDGWRWFFYMEGGFFIISLLGIYFFYRPPPRGTIEQSFTFKEKMKRLDFVGWGLQSGGFLFFLIGMSWGGGGAYSWRSGRVAGFLAVGLVLLLCFVLYEWKGRSDGLAPHALFRDRNYPLSLLAIFLEGMILFSFLTEYSGEVLKVWTTSALDEGYRIMAFPIAGMVVTPLWAYIATKYKNVKWLNSLGFVFFVIAAVLLATAKTRTSTQSVIADAIGGIAYSLPLALLITSAQLAVPPKYIGVGSALLATCRATGSSISVSIFNALLNPKLAARLTPYVRQAALDAGLPAAHVAAAVAATTAAVSASYSPAKLQAIPGMNQQIVDACFGAARQAYYESYRYIWYFVIGLSAFGAVLLIAFRPAHEQMNSQIDAPAEDVHAHRNGGSSKA